MIWLYVYDMVVYDVSLALCVVGTPTHAPAKTHTNKPIGMGDVLTLVEKAEEAIKKEEADAALKRIMTNKFDFDDFLSQYRMVTRMGTMGQVMKLLPGVCVWGGGVGGQVACA